MLKSMACIFIDGKCTQYILASFLQSTKHAIYALIHMKHYGTCTENSKDQVLYSLQECLDYGLGTQNTSILCENDKLWYFQVRFLHYYEAKHHFISSLFYAGHIFGALPAISNSERLSKRNRVMTKQRKRALQIQQALFSCSVKQTDVQY